MTTVTVNLKAADGSVSHLTVPLTVAAASGALTGYPTSPSQVGLGGVGVALSSLVQIGTGPGQVSSGQGWTLSGGIVTIGGANTVFQGYQCPYQIEPAAPNITIQRNDISGTGNSWAIGMKPGGAGLIVQDNNIHGPVNADGSAMVGPSRLQYGIFQNENSQIPVTVRRNYFYSICHYIQAECGVIQQNYCHKTAVNTASGSNVDHLDAFFSGGGTPTPLLIDRNTFILDWKGDGLAGCIMLNNAFGVQSNRSITGNFLAGANFAIYAGEDQKGSANDTITGNKFSTMIWPNCGQYGPSTGVNSGAGFVWSNNTWADGPNAGKAVPA